MLFSNSQILFHAPIIRILGNFLSLLSGSKENWGPGWAVGGWGGGWEFRPGDPICIRS